MPKRLFPIRNSSYAKDSRYAYFWNCTSGPRAEPSPCWVKIPDSDGPTLSVLNEYYAVDAGQAYFLGRAILKADPSSFVVVFPEHSSHERHYDKFAKDKHCCYCFGYPLEGSDPETFKVLNDLFALDKNHAYCRFKTIVEADPKTFHVDAENEFASDGKGVFVFAFGFSDQEYACLQADESTFKEVHLPIKIGESSPQYQDKDYYYCFTPKGIAKLPIVEKTSVQFDEVLDCGKYPQAASLPEASSPAHPPAPFVGPGKKEVVKQLRRHKKGPMKTITLGRGDPQYVIHYDNDHYELCRLEYDTAERHKITEKGHVEGYLMPEMYWGALRIGTPILRQADLHAFLTELDSWPGWKEVES